ncbi:MAG: SAM-dependent methyltransferase [Gammaproteobacteria bacterium]|nr:SAM-dependent methyltransferase [Gammaproteobacteria bacterium]
MNEPHSKQQAVAVLPEPDAEARTWSQALCAQIEEQCNLARGWLPFSEFMQLALYAPGLGYYSSDLRKFGVEVDFITAPEVSPLFAQCIARQVADVLSTMTSASVLEFGAGSGVMAADMLLKLEQLDALPERYLILELSASLKQRQQATIKQKARHLLDRVVWLDGLPEDKFSGVVVANEVLDAMPVECFRINRGEVEMLCVHCENNVLSSEYKVAEKNIESAIRNIEQRIESKLPDGYCSEFNPAVSGWLQSIAATLEQGMVLLVDYGYAAAEYYHEERQSGTLMCHY